MRRTSLPGAEIATVFTPRLLRARCGHLLVAALLGLTACGGSVELVGALQEAEANEVLGALLNAGIEARKFANKAGIVITVDQSSIARAIEVIAQQGLPRERHATMGDIFKKENLISSPLEERARYLYALSQELERTLSRIDGVISSRVHVVLPERVGPSDPMLPSSTSVFIKHQAGFGVEGVVSQVRSLVANSIPGLTLEKVVVVLVPAVSREIAVGNGPRLENVLFFKVEQGSAAALRVMLATMFAAAVLAAAMVVYLIVRGGQLSSPGEWLNRIRDAR
jgi:type III secretion protein J